MQLPSRRAARAAGKAATLKQTIVAGAGANTSIAVAGLKKSDELVSVIDLAGNDRTATAIIYSAGNLRVSVSTAGAQLLVTYWSF